MFLGDYFARGSKRSGAWCSSFRDQTQAGPGGAAGGGQCLQLRASRPQGTPALLSYDDARTLFHEFGHALHGMLSDVTYPSISGTSVARDFVELPSQLYEHWLEVPEVLQNHAPPCRDRRPMPKAMLDRLLAAQTYDMGFQTVEYVASALVDLAFHDGPAPADPMAGAGGGCWRELGMPHAIRMRHATPHFAPCLLRRRLFLGLLFLHVVRSDGCRCLRRLPTRPATPSIPPPAAKLERFMLSAGGSQEADALYTAVPRPDAGGRGAAEGPGAGQRGLRVQSQIPFSFTPFHGSSTCSARGCEIGVSGSTRPIIRCSRRVRGAVGARVRQQRYSSITAPCCS